MVTIWAVWSNPLVTNLNHLVDSTNIHSQRESSVLERQFTIQTDDNPKITWLHIRRLAVMHTAGAMNYAGSDDRTELIISRREYVRDLESCGLEKESEQEMRAWLSTLLILDLPAACTTLTKLDIQIYLASGHQRFLFELKPAAARTRIVREDLAQSSHRN